MTMKRKDENDDTELGKTVPYKLVFLIIGLIMILIYILST